MELLIALGSITLINLILSGDNAVVIALASRNLPHDQRKKAVLWGSAGAVVLRILLTMIAAFLLKIPYVQFLGGIALVYIAVNLLGDEHKEVACEGAESFWEAIKIIIFADLIMSLDNVLAIAGVANGHIGLLIFGLALSVPLVVFGSQMLMKLMDRYPIIIYLGAAILAWTAAKMMVADAVLGVWLQPYAVLLEIGVTAAALLIGYWRKKQGLEPVRRENKAASGEHHHEA
ncbi:TerC family protein [Sporomusa acidovorans]|uniref:Integral membrane protein TerC family protein n=1 Tax=Sporomusa acidovorans (strain ATCC 49682 / DSM 3132 / Mol) TaxID=1123286 RepID=A0ABZ3J1K6_SPOA4|nr:TerC family protein [Sporomusa acidovorans]OZC14977.1 integral membrane protein TerC family protein [Sporomusa acidovorans DSM 3132]SDE83330.1 integral membrane protein, YjbE family [Sporomusa acidovorans]